MNAIFSTFSEYFDNIIQVFLIIDTTNEKIFSSHDNAILLWQLLYGPLCSTASQVTIKRSKLKPRLASRAKC